MVQLAISTKDAVSSSGVPRPQNTPRLGLFVYVLSSVAVVGGFLFGYDTGIVSSAMLFVVDNSGMRPVSHFWQELIVAVTPGCAGLSSLVAGPVADKFGRKNTILVSSFLFTIGAVVCCIAPYKSILLIGRILLGLAIGFSSMVVPVYVCEVSPSHLRGKLVTLFQLMITFGLFAAAIIAGFLSYVDPVNWGWRLMFGLAAVPAIAQFVIFWSLPESPRWLFKTGNKTAAREVLNKVYSGNEEWVDYESAEIAAAVLADERDYAQQDGRAVLARVLRTPHIRRALLIGCLLQAFQQLSGINTIMYYAGTIIRAAGVSNKHTTIWISAAICSVNFLCTFVPLFTIERVGRRKLLLVSVAGVALSVAAMGGAFLLINKDSTKAAPSQFWDKGVRNAAYCSRYSNCDSCVTSDACGFCMVNKGTVGHCLPIDASNPSERSATGLCENGTGIESFQRDLRWQDSYCTTTWTWLPILIMVVYLCFFSIGYAPLTWILNTEFYPNWARGVCSGLATATNWTFNLLISLTFLSLSHAVTKYGTFFIYAGITVVAWLFAFVFVPETSGLSIEHIERLFMTRAQRAAVYANNEKRQRQEDSANNNNEIELPVAKTAV